jgi:hypothetical protein
VGAYQVLRHTTGAFATACQPGRTSQSLTGLPNTLANFNVSAASSVEATTPLWVYQLTSKTTQGAAATPSYVERQMSVTIAK